MTTNTLIEECNNDLDKLCSTASPDLNWKPITMPLLIQGRHTNKLIDNRVALVHNRTGAFLDIASKSYRPHPVREVLNELLPQIDPVAIVTNIRTVGDGQSVIVDAKYRDNVDQSGFGKPTADPAAVAQFKAIGQGLDYDAAKQARYEAGYRKGQALGGASPTTSGFSLKIGNTVGNPLSITAVVTEIRCLNGLVAEKAKMLRITSHRRGTDSAASDLRKLLPGLYAQAQAILQARETLLATQANDAIHRAYLLELTQPDLFTEVLAATIANHGENTPDVNRNYFLASLTSHEQVEWMLNHKIEHQATSRKFRTLLDHVVDQPIVDGAGNTLWAPYMAATYCQDHLSRSDSPTSRADSSLFGPGAEFKAQALNLALEYAQAIASPVAIH